MYAIITVKYIYYDAIYIIEVIEMNETKLKKLVGEEEANRIIARIVTGKYKTAYRYDRYVIVDIETNEILLSFKNEQDRTNFLHVVG